MNRRKRNKGDDPLLCGCRTCGALAGQGCRDVLGDPPPELVSRATRLVHRARLEGGDDAA